MVVQTVAEQSVVQNELQLLFSAFTDVVRFTGAFLGKVFKSDFYNGIYDEFVFL